MAVGNHLVDIIDAENRIKRSGAFYWFAGDEQCDKTEGAGKGLILSLGIKKAGQLPRLNFIKILRLVDRNVIDLHCSSSNWCYSCTCIFEDEESVTGY